MSTFYLIFEAEDEGLEVDVYHLARRLNSNVDDCANLGGSRVVKGYVQPSELLHRSIHHALAVGFLQVAIFWNRGLSDRYAIPKEFA